MKKFIYKILKYFTIILLFMIIINQNNIVSKATEENVDDTIIDAEKWDEWQKEDYWEWHTRTTTDDIAYNGNHIVIQNDVIDFYGYWQNSYKDFLYKEYKNPGKKIFKFVINESNANYHTLDGAGFIFNANKTETELSGYILLFRQKDVSIYRLDNVNIATFETTPNATLETYGEVIATVPKTNSQIHNLIVEITPTKINVAEEETQLLDVELDYSKHSGESFGLISSYVQHACSQLSKIEFSQIEIILEDYEFSILNTNMENIPIQGGYFELKNEDEEIIKEGKTDKNSKFIIDGIKPGIYTIEQKEISEGYILNETVYKFEITNDGKMIDVNTKEELNLVIKNEKIKKQNDDKNDDKIDNKDDNNKNNISDSNNKNDQNIENNKIQNTTINGKDYTVSSTPMPKAGKEIFMAGVTTITILTLSIFSIIKFKKYNKIK